MAFQEFLPGDNGAQVRGKLNANFREVYTGGGLVVEIDQSASPYTVPDLAADLTFTIIASATSGPITINLPLLANNVNRILNVVAADVAGGSVTLDGSGAETINDATTLVLTTQHSTATVQATPTKGWRVL